MLWEVMEDDSIKTPLLENLTVEQFKSHNDEGRAIVTIQKNFIWWYFHQYYYSENCKGSLQLVEGGVLSEWKKINMQVLNLRRVFEAVKNKESESIKEFIDKLLKVVTCIRLFDE